MTMMTITMIIKVMVTEITKNNVNADNSISSNDIMIIITITI